MTDRIDQALDGQLPADDLTPAERAAVSAFERRADELRQGLAERMPGDLDERIMGRIRAQGLEPLPARSDSVLARAARGLWAPRELRLTLRPAWALAAAAGLALLIAVPVARRSTPPRQPAIEAAGAAAQPTAQRIYVQFRFDAKQARDVALAGSFSDWRPSVPMQRSDDGVWTVTLPVEPGVHDYAFVVDGDRWVPDPYAPAVDDGFGGRNSRLTVLAPGSTL